MSTLIEPERYLGIDGSSSPFADVITDLVSYRSRAAGIFMRHVLEHNREWEKILDNAFASFRERFALVLFTPMSTDGAVHEIGFAKDIGVPDLSFPLSAFTPYFKGCDWSHRTLNTDTQYGEETIFFVSRNRLAEQGSP